MDQDAIIAAILTAGMLANATPSQKIPHGRGEKYDLTRARLAVLAADLYKAVLNEIKNPSP